MMTIYGFSDILTSPIGERLSVLARKTLLSQLVEFSELPRFASRANRVSDVQASRSGFFVCIASAGEPRRGHASRAAHG
jgi:hypothetical protein